MGLLTDIGLGAVNPVALLGTGIAAGGDIASYFGQQDTNATNAAIAAGANVSNDQMAALTNQNQRDIANANINYETEFAQNGIQWRVADAAKAGISPLAALGATEPSFSPVSAVFDTPQAVTPNYSSPLSAAAAGIPAMGANVSNALTATRSPIQQASDAADLAFKTKTNDLLDLQIRQAQLSIARQGSTPGIPSAYQSVMNADGSTSLVESPEAIHGGFGGNLLWSLNNKLIPALQEMGGGGNAGVDMSYPAD